MHPLQTFITTTHFFGRDFAHNLDFLSDEQLRFKPSPTANNALEITQQNAGHLLNMKAALTGGGFGDVPASREQAKEFLTRAVHEYSIGCGRSTAATSASLCRCRSVSCRAQIVKFVREVSPEEWSRSCQHERAGHLKVWRR